MSDAWTTPVDWDTDEEVTSTKMNAQVYRNMRWLNEARPRCTMAGTVAVASGSGFATPTGTWSTVSPNAGSMYASSTAMYLNTGTPGAFQFSLMVIYSTSATGKRGAVISTSAAGGGTILAEDVREPTAGTETTAITITTPLVQLGSTAIHFGIRQNSGGSMNCTVRFSGLWVAT